MDRYPTTLNLGGHGIKVGAEFDLYRLATAAAFLRQVTPTSRVYSQSPGSYWLKHAAERWGAANGMSPYISNGELIAAAVTLGFPVSWRGGLNVQVGIRAKSLAATVAGLGPIY